MASSVDSNVVESVATQSSPSGQNTFEAFVKSAIHKIQRESWGRSSEVVEIRNACQSFLDHLNNDEGSTSLGIPFNEQRTRAALKPLKLACSCSIVRIVEPALGCLHKLVAYAWIHGESTDTGNMDDGTMVTEIVEMVVKCIQLGNASIYLAVIRALLTFATADHFVAHGHCLLHMVRTVFNLAVSCEESNLKRTACNALLQMLNTVVKRVVVTQFQMAAHRSQTSIESVSDSGLQGIVCEDLAAETTTVVGGTSDSASTAEDVQRNAETSGTWKLADLAEKQDIEALEAAFENKQRVMEGSAVYQTKTVEARKGQTSDGQDSSRNEAETNNESETTQVSPSKPGKRPKGWDQLTLLEKDVLVVLMAFCKLAGVNTSSVTSENYVRHGKLLALELLVKVFENTSHRWENVRLVFCEQLRFPLCLVLIRNCNPAETKAFQFAIRLFVSVIMQVQVRLGLKAELGALYPLLLLRPVESNTLDPALLTVTLTGIKRISREPQMQVDLFINYDCNLKAPNLYERTAKALSKLAVYGDPNAPPTQSALLREAASACAMAMLSSLDAWAGPIRDAAHVREISSQESVTKENASGNGSVLGTTSEVRHFGAAKERKNSLSVGIELFNKNPAKGIASLVASGVVLNKPESIALFLRKNREQLDPAMLGEYLGLHDEIPLKVMHAYIDLERYQGITIDAALRKLISQFRLPGEAQQIDRIMEKFAERYCQDNATSFQCADDAYVLSFSLIMLNTDMHNPMAEKRLTKQDFVSMNMRQHTDGTYVEVLPPVELEAMYDRIAADEIRTLHSKPELTPKQEKDIAQHRNLASAVGLTQLALPFRSGRIWDKARGAQIEHEHLLALTQKAMRSGAVDAELWFTATHTEHSRPMLEIAGLHFQKALAAAIESASDKEAAERSIGSLVVAIQLSSLLGLDTLCQQFVTTLSRAIGLHSKEALIRANPHRQIAALRALIGVSSDEQAMLLGSSWTIILRTISSVEALISDMRRGHKSQHSVFEESMQNMFIQLSTEKKDNDKSTALGRFFTQIGITKSDVEMFGSIPPGQAIRTWSSGEGITEMDRVFVRSASLDGEAVVTFCKALCAVSHEELNPAVPLSDGTPPRVFSLRKLVECAYYNLGRIRLIWGRLWSTISSHLVNASCHSDQTVAMYSVDSLRQLVGKLLSRDELANFTTQSDTLRPFVIVLKQCANVEVRELAVQCIEQAMNTHSSRLGSGWVVILEFLSVASLDLSPSVTRQCIDTLHSVVNVHWRKWGRGRDALADCVNVALRVARNPHNTDCSLRAIQLINTCAKELVVELVESGGDETSRSASVDYAAEALQNTDIERTSSAPDTSQSDVPTAKEIPVTSEPLLSRSSLWTVIFQALVEVINREERRRCSDSAAGVLFGFLATEYSSTWDQRTWTVFQFALHNVFNLKENAYSVESGLDRILSYSTSFLPTLFSVIISNYKTVGKSLLAHVSDILLGWLISENQALALSGVYFFQEMVMTTAKELDDEGWSIIVARLQGAWTVCVSHGEKTDTNVPEPFVSWIRNPVPLDVAVIRTRCHVLIALQRTVHETHEKLGEYMPKKCSSRLVDILLQAVQQTAEVNKDSEFLKEFARISIQASTPLQKGTNVISETPGVETRATTNPEESADSRDPVYRVEQAKTSEGTADYTSGEIKTEQAVENDVSETDVQEQEEEQTMDELPSLQTEFSQLPRITQPATNSDQDREDSTVPEDFPQLLTELHSSTEETSFKGFLKIHVEGGILTISALLRQQSAKVVQNSYLRHLLLIALQDATVEETERLLSFCRGLIIQASAETKRLIARSRETSEFGTVPTYWEQAVKAPLVIQALEAYKNVDGKLLTTEVIELIPHLSMLICNPQSTIRHSISEFMKLKTSTVLNLQSGAADV